MPMEPAFRKHLHELMIEVSESIADSEAQFKAETIWKAQKTNNAAAMPIAYKDAAIHALHTRYEKTIDKYLDALTTWGIGIDDAVEAEMLREMNMLTAGPNSLQFPPAMNVSNQQAVQSAYSHERQRVAHNLQRSAANRLRELKMKSKRDEQRSKQAFMPNVQITNGSLYIDSVDRSTNSYTIHFAFGVSDLATIDLISEGHPELERAANDIRNSPSASRSAFEAATKWLGMVGTVEGLTEKAIQLYPHF